MRKPGHRTFRGNRTYAPDESGLAGGAIVPASEGLILHCGPDSIITDAAEGGDFRAIGWTNLVYPINGHRFAFNDNISITGPYTRINTLDGHPLLTWRHDVDKTERMELDQVGGGNLSVGIRDRNGVLLHDGTPGLHKPFTWIWMCVPEFSPEQFNFTGGALGFMAPGPFDVGLFCLADDLHANASYMFATKQDWGRGSNLCQEGPAIPGGAGGFYNGRPIFFEVSSAGGTDIQARINRVVQPLTPGVLNLTETGSANACQLGVSFGSGNDAIFRWKGLIGHEMIYDYKLTTNPTAEAQTYAFLSATWPSV